MQLLGKQLQEKTFRIQSLFKCCTILKEDNMKITDRWSTWKRKMSEVALSLGDRQDMVPIFKKSFVSPCINRTSQFPRVPWPPVPGSLFHLGWWWLCWLCWPDWLQPTGPPGCRCQPSWVQEVWWSHKAKSSYFHEVGVVVRGFGNNDRGTKAPWRNLGHKYYWQGTKARTLFERKMFYQIFTTQNSLFKDAEAFQSSSKMSI